MYFLFSFKLNKKNENYLNEVSCVLFSQAEQLNMGELSKTIPIFRGDYFFLSNFYLTDIELRGQIFKSAEHLYQATKCSMRSDRDKILNAPTSKSAKVFSRFVEKRPHWDVDKVRIMERILRMKFRNKKLKKLLRKTGDKQLIDQNYYHDTFWGVCGCTKHQRTGENILGKILMKIRADYFPSKSMLPYPMCRL